MKNQTIPYGIVLGTALSTLNCGANVEISSPNELTDGGTTDSEIKDATSDVHDAVSDALIDSNTDCELIDGIEPEGITLGTNPYNPTLTTDAGYPYADDLQITVTLLQTCEVSTHVLDGDNLVKTFESNSTWDPGTLHYYFNGKDNSGVLLEPGTYTVVISATNDSCTDKASKDLEIIY